MRADGTFSVVVGGITTHCLRTDSLMECTDVSESVMVYLGDVVRAREISVTVPSRQLSVGVGRYRILVPGWKQIFWSR